MIRPATLEDIHSIQRRGAFTSEEWLEALAAASSLGDEWLASHTFAVVDGPEVYGVVGWSEVAPGRVEVFAFVDVKAAERPVWFMRESRRGTDEACSTWNTLRAVITVDPDDEAAAAYARSIGFEQSPTDATAYEMVRTNDGPVRRIGGTG